MKLVTIVLIVVAAIVVAYFFYQGKKSFSVLAPEVSGANLPVCGVKPNCVCSQQATTDEHYIEPISGSGVALGKMTEMIETLGGVVVSSNGTGLHATFTSGLFKFVDDVLITKQGDTFHVRSSSRVGHSDLGANRKRVERLRQMLSPDAS